MVKRVTCLMAMLLMVAFLVGCAPVAVVKPEPQVRVWPAAPEPARIAWVRSFSRPEDLGIHRTFLQRLKDILFGESEAKMVRPMAVAALGQVVYVADPGAKGVHRFDTASGDYRLILADDGSPLPSPVGLARCGAEMLVTDSSRAQVLALPAGEGGAHVLALDAKLQQPTGLACDEATGRVFVSDTAAHQVAVFKRSGRALSLEKTFGQRGAAIGEFNFPTYLWWAQGELAGDGKGQGQGQGPGRLYVSDALNFRIQVFDGEGRGLGAFGKLGDGSGDAARQKGVATDSQGHVYVVDALFHAFQIFDAKGGFLLAVGARGGDPGEFWLPTGIFIDHDTIYVADSYNSRVQVFRYLGAAP